MIRNLYIIHKIGHNCMIKRIPIIPKIMKIFEKILFPGCDIPFITKIGEGAYFPHRAIGVVIHEKAIIGKNATIQANVVIGGKADGGVPVIGDNVQIGANACVLGGVTIGDNVFVGAGAVVVNDVPNGCTVVGIPAKIIKRV